MKVKSVPIELVAQTCLNMAALKQPAHHDNMLIDALVKIYHQDVPPTMQVYQEGVQAGIRYALMATKQYVQGISLNMKGREVK